MLSPQNPSLDPSFPPHEISQELKSSNERPSLQEDLLNKSGSGSDDNNPPHNFSIRGYVFGARIKDIETNWPFSQKTLRICQKHGVKNPLPPFHSLNAVTNQCVSRFTVDASSVEAKDNEKPSARNGHLASVASGDIGCGEERVNIVLSKSDGDKKILSGLEKASPTVKQKAETSLKKCKLIVKVGGADPSANGDSTVNSVAFAETSMGSQVCPVCKNFSSSSNTTLNAHIDQCLSMESPTKLNDSPRVIRHRLKPRKTKLMVDIYTTAPHCTLEELDRRNGTSWGVNSMIQETEFAAEVEEQKEEDAVAEEEEEEQKEDDAEDEQKEEADEDEVEPRVSSVNISGNGYESAVYIDANGTKVRILSKFNDISQPVPKLKEDHQHLKAGSRKKLTSTFKKKHLVKKHHKYLNVTLDARRSTKFCYPMSQRTFKVDDVEERNISPEENSWKEQSPVQPMQCQEKTNSDDSGTIAKWASSKRRVLLRKRSCKEGLQQLASNFRPTESDRSRFTDPRKIRTRPVASPNCSKRIEEAPLRSAVYEFDDRSSVRKRVGGASFGPQQIGNIEKYPEPPKKKKKLLRKESDSAFRSFKDSFAFNPAETSVSRDKHVPSPKASKFSSPRKHFSVNHSPLLEPRYNVGKTSSFGKKSEKVAASKVSFGKRGTVGIREKRALGFVSSSVDVGNRKGSSLRNGGDLADLSSDMDSGREGVAVQEDNMVSGPSSGVDVVRNVTSKSFHNSNTTSGSLQSDVYKRSLCGTEATLCPMNRSFHDEQMFGDDEDEDVGVEMDSRDVQRDFFTGVETIPIPGPPGSFLPSPRNMGSEDVQGNSSLTVSRVQSSDDRYDLVDRDSSNSPISAKSTISNSKCAESSSAGYRDEIRSSFPVAAKPAKPPQEEDITTRNFPVSFRNDQPCCCSRKEGISQGGFLNYQDSQLLRRRTVAASVQVPIDAAAMKVAADYAPATSFRVTSVAEKNAAAVKVAADYAPKSGFGASESASPSGSNPVLRLMGKNLMVVNKSETVPEQPRPVLSNNYPDSGTIGNANPDSLRRRMISNQSQYNTSATHFNPRTPQTSGNASFGGCSGFEQHDYGQQIRYRNPNPQAYPLAAAAVYNVVKVAKASDSRRQWNVDTTTIPMKEIIIIDDGPETEPNHGESGGGGVRNSRVIAGDGFSAPPPTAAANNHPCYVSPFYSFRPHDSPPYFQMPPQSRAGGSPNKWNRSPGGSQTTSFAAPPLPPTSSRLRPPLYYTPNFS